MDGFDFRMRATAGQFGFGSDKVELFAFQLGDGGDYAAEQLSMKQKSQHEHSDPFCTLTKAEAQILMDDLWMVGLRPSEGTGSAGAMKAVQGHLADLKKILFHKMGIKDGN